MSLTQCPPACNFRTAVLVAPVARKDRILHGPGRAADTVRDWGMLQYVSAAVVLRCGHFPRPPSPSSWHALSPCLAQIDHGCSPLLSLTPLLILAAYFVLSVSIDHIISPVDRNAVYVIFEPLCFLQPHSTTCLNRAHHCVQLRHHIADVHQIFCAIAPFPGFFLLGSSTFAMLHADRQPRARSACRRDPRRREPRPQEQSARK
eukprot:3013455-Rhodomonas_salina.7